MSICVYTKNEQVKRGCIVVWLDWNFTGVAGSVGTAPYFPWLSALCVSLSVAVCLCLLNKTSCGKHLDVTPSCRSSAPCI